MKLKLGKIASKDLAKWFNVSYSYFRKENNKYFDQLSLYCDYEKVYGGAIIKEIYIEEYNKDLKLRQTQTYLKSLCKHDNLISLSGLKKEFGISYYHSRRIRDELFGDKPLNIDPEAHGILGSREMIWAIKLGDNKYRKLTPEEDKLFDALIVQTYSDIDPNQLKAQQLILDYCAKEGMSAQDYKDIIEDKGLGFFNDIIQRFKKITGQQLGRPTEHFIDVQESDDEYRKYLLEEINKIKNEMKK